jgi:single-stranded-DNA-specific exonuclease
METATTTVFRWTLRPVPDEARVAALSEALNRLPEPLARSLVLRGVGDFDETGRRRRR